MHWYLSKKKLRTFLCSRLISILYSYSKIAFNPFKRWIYDSIWNTTEDGLIGSTVYIHVLVSSLVFKKNCFNNYLHLIWTCCLWCVLYPVYLASSLQTKFNVYNVLLISISKYLRENLKGLQFRDPLWLC